MEVHYTAAWNGTSRQESIIVKIQPWKLTDLMTRTSNEGREK
jgi:hypothetical protein